MEQRLEALARKGLVYRFIRNDVVYYSLNDAFFMLRTLGWQGKNDEYSRKITPITNRYFSTGFMEPWRSTKYQGLRVLPIESSLEDGRQVLPYEEVTKVLDSFTYFTVSACPCAHRNNLDSERHDCEYPVERSCTLTDWGITLLSREWDVR